MRSSGRIISCKLARYGLDAPDHAGLELACLESGLHIATNSFPVRLADLGVDAAVGDDLDDTVGEQEIDQHAVIVLRIPDPQMREDVERAFACRLVVEQRRAIQRALD